MPDFDAMKEVQALGNILESSGHISTGYSGGALAIRFLDDAQKEFCKLSPTETKATIEAMESYRNPYYYFQVHRNGHDDPIGVSHSKDNNSETVYLSFDCPFKTK